MMVGSAAPAPGTGSSNNPGQILQPAISLRRALYPLSGAAAAARERLGTASSFRLGLFNATLR
jgi:hypothetical protein